MISSRAATEIISFSILSFVLLMSHSCLVMAAVGSNCTDSNCNALGEICNSASNSCICNMGYTAVSTLCKAGLNYPCALSNDCNVSYAECQINASSTCQCKSGYSNVNGVCKADLRSECALNSHPECTDVNANCSGSCECRISFYNSSNNCTTTSYLQVQHLNVTAVMETSLFVQWENPVKYNDVSKYQMSWKRLNATELLGTKEVSRDYTSVNLSTNLTAAVAYKITVTSYESSAINISTSVQQATKPYKPDRIDVNGSNFDLEKSVLNITWHYSGIITGIDIRFLVLLTDSRSSKTVGTSSQVTTNYVTFPSAGLKNGYWYNVSITAMSEEYTSPTGPKRVNSDVLIDSFRTAVKVPDPPLSLTCLNATDTNISLMWIGPNNSNGDILYFNITVNRTSPDPVSYKVRTLKDDLQYTVMNLQAGSFYTFEVYTVNEEYQSQDYAVVRDCETSAPVADKPMDLDISNVSSRSGVVTWKKPNTLSGVNYGYSLQIHSNESCNREVIWKCSDCQGMFPNLTSSGCLLIVNQSRSSSELGYLQSYEALELSPDINYTVTVSAITKPGRGLVNNAYLLTLEEAPKKPYNLDVVSITSKEAKVAWNINGPRPGQTKYDIRLVADKVAQLNLTVIGFSNTSCQLTGLEEYWDYSVTVEARTTKGINTSYPKSFRTKIGPAGKVRNCEVRKGSGGDMYVTAKVSWKLPEILQRNGPINSFMVQQEEMIDSSFKMIKNSNVSVVTNDDDHTYIQDFQVQPEKQYRFSVSALNDFIYPGESCSTNYTAPAAPVEPTNVSVGALVGGIVGGVVAAAIVIAVVIFILRRKSGKRKKVKSTKKKKEFRVIKKERPIHLANFTEYVETYHKDSNLKFSAEYEDLKTMSPKHPHQAADLEENHQKNRFFNILPFDHSRVKLLSIDDVPGSDYINACYLQGFTSSREYIACQGPIPSTIEDHWRLIWEQNVQVIVMLTQYKENSMVKCEPYMPLELKDPKQYGKLVVECLTFSSMNSFEYRTLKVTLGEKERTIKHFHFLSWRDFSADVQLDIMIDFIKEVRNFIQPPDLEGPMIVHCSAGVGRTGTFIAIDFMIQHIDKYGPDTTVDIFNFVLKMRENRTSMVQTEEQYIFIHDCIKEYLNRLKTYENQAFSIDDEHLYQNTNVQLYENVNIDSNQNTEL